MIFTGAEGGEVIMLSSDDQVKGDEDGSAEGAEVGGEDKEIDVDEWRSVFPNDPDDGTGPDLARGTSYLTRKDWLGLLRPKVVQFSLNLYFMFDYAKLSIFMFACMLLSVESALNLIQLKFTMFSLGIDYLYILH